MSRYFLTLNLSLLTLTLFAPTAMAASPGLGRLIPNGGQRGTELEVTIAGSNLQDAEEVMIYDAGIEVLSLEVVKDKDGNSDGKQLKAMIKIAEDAELGAKRVRVRTRTGMTNLQVFHVGALPVIAETEPNTIFTEPQAIEQNVTVQGRIDSEDVDYFVVEAKQGQRLSAEVFGMRMGRSGGANYFDPYLAIMSEDRNELVASDDPALVWNDATVSTIIPADGKYIIALRDSAYNGDGNADYHLHIGSFPRPMSIVPAGGKPGETLSVTFLGDPTGAITREVTLPIEMSERFGLAVEDEHGVSPSWNWFRLANLDNAIEVEPNNSHTEATPATGPGAFNGVLTDGDEADYFKFTGTKDQQFDIEVYARRIRSELDPVVYVYNMADGAQLAANDDSRGPDSYLRFTVPADGEYAVAVRDHLRQGSDAHTYRVEVTPIEPKIVARPTEFSRYVQPQLIIPQGGGCGVVVNVSRSDFGGPVNFRSDDLPAGVSIECPEGWRGGGSMPVVFYAADDAPVGGKYASIITHLADPNQERVIEGPLSQLNLMIRGRNNERVWEEEELRMPVVVTDAAPFRIRIEQPPVPLVRGGSMNLKIIAERNEGYAEAIKIDMLQNPPGVNSSVSVTIPGDQTEALMSINAAGNAAVQTTMIAVRGTAKVGNGSMETCSPFVPLIVEEQYLQFEYQAASVEQGQETPVIVKVTKRKDFEGEANVKLVGLPANTTADDLKVTKDSTELIFNVKTQEGSPPGNHQNLFCQVDVPEAGTTILHNLGTGRLQIDKPIPPKTDQPQPAQPVAQAPPTEKPLSRLERLRLEQKQRVEAARAAEEAAASTETAANSTGG
ncbi:MAG: PPC domain-containing protein [Planctomycetaceae bacterium]|nr:PPC domain-containing protein [Planctomycetaceae bacterium]